MKPRSAHVNDGLSDRSASPAPLLDADRVAELLRVRQVLPSKFLDDLMNVRIVRYSPRKTDSVAVEWSLMTKQGTHHALYATWDAEPQRAEPVVPEARGATSDTDPTSLLVRLHDHRVAIHSFDRDRRLAHLACCLDADSMSSRLAGLLDPADPIDTMSEGALRCSLLAYRPGRRAAIGYSRNSGAGGQMGLVGKTFHDLRGDRIVELNRRLQPAIQSVSNGCVDIAHAVDFLPDLKMALFQRSAGLGGNDGAVSIDRRLEAGATAAAAIHSLTDEALPRFDVEHECAILRRWYGFLQRVDPRRGARAEPLFSAVKRAAEGLRPAHRVPIHRDFYEKQLLIADKAVTVLDLDTLGWGDPCVDLGNFLAHQILRGLRGRDSRGDFERYRDSFLAAYATRRGAVDQSSLAFYLASSLFRLGAVHAFRSTTGCFAEALWQAGVEQLAASGIGLRMRHGPTNGGDGQCGAAMERDLFSGSRLAATEE